MSLYSLQILLTGFKWGLVGSALPDKDEQGSWGSGAILSLASSPLLSSTPSPLLAGPLQGKHLD